MISYQPTQQAGWIFLFSDKIFLSAGKINIEDSPVLTPNIVTEESWRNEIKKKNSRKYHQVFHHPSDWRTVGMCWQLHWLRLVCWRWR